MRYVYTGEQVVPKQCKFGPRPAEGIVLNTLEWWNITDHLAKDQRERKLAEMQKVKEIQKKNISFEMTKNWSNTLASVKTQSEQKRVEKKKKEEQDKINLYNEILRNRMEEKKEILKKIKKTINEYRESTKTLKSGLLHSMVLKERQQQIALKNIIIKEEKNKDMELGMKLKAEAEEFEKQILEQKINERNKKKKLKEALDKQLNELNLKKKEETEEKAREKQDLLNMEVESEKIRQCNAVEKRYRQECVSKYAQKVQNQIEYEQKLALEQEEEDEINKIYVNYAIKFEKERKEKERLSLKTIMDERTKFSQNLMKKSDNLIEAEEKRLEAIETENFALMAKASEEKLKKRAALHSAFFEEKKKLNDIESRKKYEEREVTKWEVIQACKTTEVNENWKKSMKNRLEDQKEKTRIAYDEQIKEKKEKMAKEAIRAKECLTPEEDLIEGVEEVLNLVKIHDLPAYPVLAAVSKLKKNQVPNVEDNKIKRNNFEKIENLERTKKLEFPGNAWYCFKC